MKRIQLLALFLVIVFSACNEMATEIVSGDDYYAGDELAVMGYLSNKGAVVNLQKTQAPLADSLVPGIVPNALVQLKRSGSDEVVATFKKMDDYNYITPSDFVPETDQTYSISVSAPGFESVHSGGQKVHHSLPIQNLNVEVEEVNYWKADTTEYYLFGRPRSIKVQCSVLNPNQKINNKTFRVISYKGTDAFYNGQGNRIDQTWAPSFFFNLNSGINRYVLVPLEFQNLIYMQDQIKTNRSVAYNNASWVVLERIDRILVQALTFSPDMMEFLIAVTDYLENRSNPFSISAQKLPSNMSNGVGYFGSMSIAEEWVEIPPCLRDSINGYQP